MVRTPDLPHCLRARFPISRCPDHPIFLCVPSCPLWLNAFRSSSVFLVYPLQIRVSIEPSPISPFRTSVSPWLNVIPLILRHLRPHPLPSLCSRSNSVFNSITSSGHSGQLCSQHTIKSHLFGIMHVRNKIPAVLLQFNVHRLPYAGRHLAHGFAVRKGDWTRVTTNPRSSAQSIQTETARPCSLVGPYTSGTCISGGP